MTRRFVSLAAFAAVAGFAATASADDIAAYKGNYVSGQIGINDLSSENYTGTGFTTKAKYDNGPALTLAFGHAYGNGFRLEAEYAYRSNDADSAAGAAATGNVRVDSIMFNALRDFSTGTSVVPFIGAGLGLARIHSDVSPIGGSVVSGNDTVPAFQVIAGAAMALGDGVDLTADLRYFGTSNPDLNLASGGRVETEYNATSFLVGLRWRLGAPAPKPMAEPVAAPAPKPMAEPAPAPAPKPAPAAVPRSFLIFFDWDKSAIRPDARRILEAAAAAAKQGSKVSIQLTGHADRSGTTRYNQRLSERRAAAAKAELVKLGLTPNAIATVGKGESQPLVSTADGVREPRNRRVEIQF